MLKPAMHIPLRRVNNYLLALIIVINAYIIAAPLLPQLHYWWQTKHGHLQQDLETKVHKQQTASSSSTPTPQPAGNQLIVPSMLLNTPVLEAPVKDTYAVLDKGIWRWPLGSTPDKGGNTVLIGHRFTYTNPKGIFYYMDKVKVDDEIGLSWNGVSYLYKVQSVTEVPPTQTSVTDPTSDARLTMYTCTPLWNPKNRLVVVASLVQPTNLGQDL